MNIMPSSKFLSHAALLFALSGCGDVVTDTQDSLRDAADTNGTDPVNNEPLTVTYTVTNADGSETYCSETDLPVTITSPNAGFLVLDETQGALSILFTEGYSSVNLTFLTDAFPTISDGDPAFPETPDVRHTVNCGSATEDFGVTNSEAVSSSVTLSEWVTSGDVEEEGCGDGWAWTCRKYPGSVHVDIEVVVVHQYNDDLMATVSLSGRTENLVWDELVDD